MAGKFVYDFEDKPKISYLIHDGEISMKVGFEDIFESEGIEILSHKFKV